MVSESLLMKYKTYYNTAKGWKVDNINDMPWKATYC